MLGRVIISLQVLQRWMLFLTHSIAKNKVAVKLERPCVALALAVYATSSPGSCARRTDGGTFVWSIKSRKTRDSRNSPETDRGVGRRPTLVWGATRDPGRAPGQHKGAKVSTLKAHISRLSFPLRFRAHMLDG